MSEWQHISSFPKPEESGFGDPFLVEFGKRSGEKVVAVCRAVRSLFEYGTWIESIQKGVTFDGSRDDNVLEPLHWRPMPAGAM